MVPTEGGSLNLILDRGAAVSHKVAAPVMENAQKKEKLDVRARSYKEGRPRWVGFIQDGSYLVGKAMPPHGMPKPSPTEGAGAVEGTERAREGCFVPELKGWVCQAPSAIL